MNMKISYWNNLKIEWKLMKIRMNKWKQERMM